MTFLPVVERELRAASRRRNTYWTRFFTALGTLLACVWVWDSFAATQMAFARGEILFRFISGLAFAYALLAGIGITSDTISHEKREGTLGLLFLTQLGGHDVILGKLAASSLNAFYRVFSVFPILAIPLLLGALTLGEFWRMTLVITNTLFFSLSAGMFVSAVSVQERRAMFGTLLLLLALTCGPPLIQANSAFQHKTAYNTAWLLTNPVYPAVLALDKAYKANPSHYWSSVAATQVLAWGLLALASVMVRRVWQDRASAGARSRWAEQWRGWRYGFGARRQRLRERLLDINPLLWLAGRNRLKRVYVLLVLGVLAAVWAWLAFKYPTSMFNSSTYLLTAYIAHLLSKLWVASEATRMLGDDRRTGALELVLSTPVSVDGILDGLLRGLERHFTWAVAVILLADAVMLLGGSLDEIRYGSSGWVLMSLGMLVIFVADLYTLAWVGLWLGLVSKSGNRAFRGTVGRVLVLPWVVFIVGLGFIATSRWQTFEPGENGLLAAAFVLSIGSDVAFFWWARANLRQKFRIAATHQHATPPSADTLIAPPAQPQTALVRVEP